MEFHGSNPRGGAGPNPVTPLASQCLVVSYSYSGNTQGIAQALRRLTGGVCREIHPWQPYPTVFPELLEQVRKEAKRSPRLLPSEAVPQTCPVVLVGSPIWCGTIAPPVAAWLKKNKLDGKIILPFYSYCGGMTGDIQGDVKRLCPKSHVRPPIGIREDGEEPLEERLRQWLLENGLRPADSPCREVCTKSPVPIL